MEARSKELSEAKGRELFEVQPSTWDLILKHCPEKELEEVKRILGTSLVEQAKDLHLEASTLLEIWRQIREDTEGMVSTQQPPSSSSHLAEPPHIRERLIAEIKFFISSLHKKTDQSSCATSSTNDDSHLVKYVTHVDDIKEVTGTSRPESSVSSRDGRETPFRACSGGGSNGSQASLLSNDEVENLGDKVNADHIEGIVTKLRQLLKEECEHSNFDLQFLQHAIEDELNFTSSLEEEQKRFVPSLKELRDFGSQLEREYLATAKFPPAAPPNSTGCPHAPAPMPPVLPKPQQLTSINRASKVRRKTADSSGHKPISSPLVLPSLESKSVTNNEPP